MITNNIGSSRLPFNKTYGKFFDNSNASGSFASINVLNNLAMQNLTALTFECFINFTGGQILFGRLLEWFAGTTRGIKIQVQSTTINSFAVTIGNGQTSTAVIGTFNPFKTFFHFAVCWNGNTISLFSGGILQKTGILIGGDIGNPNKSLLIGSAGVTATPFGGILQEIRLSNIARYTTTFVPPTAQFVNDANTVFLLHLNENSLSGILDYSSNQLPVTISGSNPPSPIIGYLANPNPFVRLPATNRPFVASRSSI